MDTLRQQAAGHGMTFTLLEQDSRGNYLARLEPDEIMRPGCEADPS